MLTNRKGAGASILARMARGFFRTGGAAEWISGTIGIVGAGSFMYNFIDLLVRHWTPVDAVLPPVLLGAWLLVTKFYPSHTFLHLLARRPAFERTAQYRKDSTEAKRLLSIARERGKALDPTLTPDTVARRLAIARSEQALGITPAVMATCSTCGFPLVDGSTACSLCGHVVVSERHDYVQRPGPLCAVCGTANLSGAFQCAVCQSELPYYEGRVEDAEYTHHLRGAGRDLEAIKRAIASGDPAAGWDSATDPTSRSHAADGSATPALASAQPPNSSGRRGVLPLKPIDLYTDEEFALLCTDIRHSLRDDADAAEEIIHSLYTVFVMRDGHHPKTPDAHIRRVKPPAPKLRRIG